MLDAQIAHQFKLGLLNTRVVSFRALNREKYIRPPTALKEVTFDHNAQHGTLDGSGRSKYPKRMDIYKI